MSNYNSTADTLLHIKRVNEIMIEFAREILRRATCHDDSKLVDPEKAGFDEYTPKLKESEYGSDEYKKNLAGLKPILDHHYQHNPHHPEHHEEGINGMNLADIVEMYADWKAAGERHPNGSMENSVKINTARFGLSEQLGRIFTNEF